MEDFRKIYGTFMEGFWLVSGVVVWWGVSGRILGGLFDFCSIAGGFCRSEVFLVEFWVVDFWWILWFWLVCGGSLGGLVEFWWNFWWIFVVESFWWISGGFCGSGVFSGGILGGLVDTRNPPNYQKFPPEAHQNHKIHQKLPRNPQDHPNFHHKPTRTTKSTRNQPKITRPPRILPEPTRNPPDHPEFHQKHIRATKPTKISPGIHHTTQNSIRNTPRATKLTRNPPETDQKIHQTTQTSTTNQPEPQNPPEIPPRIPPETPQSHKIDKIHQKIHQ